MTKHIGSVAHFNADKREVLVLPGTDGEFTMSIGQMLICMQKLDANAPSGWSIKFKTPQPTTTITTTSTDAINPIYHFQGE